MAHKYHDGGNDIISIKGLLTHFFGCVAKNVIVK